MTEYYKRFPTREELEKRWGLDEIRFEPADYPKVTGTLSAMYSCACEDLESLRKLAQAAVDGTPDDLERLKWHLEYLNGVGKLYAEDDRYSQGEKCG